MKLNSICSTWSNDRAFSFFLEWHAFTAKEVEGTITAEEALRCTYKLIFKQDLKEIREWGLFTEREGLMQMGRYHFQILWTLGSPFSFYRTYFWQNNKKPSQNSEGLLKLNQKYWFHHSWLRTKTHSLSTFSIATIITKHKISKPK